MSHKDVWAYNPENKTTQPLSLANGTLEGITRQATSPAIFDLFGPKLVEIKSFDVPTTPIGVWMETISSDVVAVGDEVVIGFGVTRNGSGDLPTANLVAYRPAQGMITAGQFSYFPVSTTKVIPANHTLWAIIVTAPATGSIQTVRAYLQADSKRTTEVPAATFAVGDIDGTTDDAWAFGVTSAGHFVRSATKINAITSGTVTGTGTNHSLTKWTGTTTIAALGLATNGQIPIGSTGADPTLAAITAGTGITVTNGAGSISIAATGGSVSGTAGQMGYFGTASTIAGDDQNRWNNTNKAQILGNTASDGTTLAGSATVPMKNAVVMNAPTSGQLAYGILYYSPAGDNVPPFWGTGRARGTFAVPLATANGDLAGEWRWNCYQDGTQGFVPGARLYATCTAAPAAGVAPMTVTLVAPSGLIYTYTGAAPSNGDVVSYDTASGTLKYTTPAGGISGLTAGRVPFAASATTLTDDADFTFATDTATITKVKVATGGVTLAKVGGALYTDTTVVGNVGAGVDTLYSQAIAASVLGANGDRLQIKVHGKMVGVAAVTQAIFSFGGATILATGTLMPDQASDWDIDIVITRLGAGSALATYTYTSPVATTGAAAFSLVGSVSLSPTLANANTFLVTGESSVLPANNDITKTLALIDYIPAP